jgi:hypothetical protein
MHSAEIAGVATHATVPRIRKVAALLGHHALNLRSPVGLAHRNRRGGRFNRLKFFIVFLLIAAALLVPAFIAADFR